METAKEVVKSLEDYTPAELKQRLKIINDAKINDRKAYKKLMSETVPDVANLLLDASKRLTEVKAIVFEYFKEVLTLKAEVYDIKEDQQSHTFTDDNYSIIIGYRVTDGWDDTASAGIAKVKAFMQSLATDEKTGKLVNTINQLLKKDAKGNLKASRVLELKSLTAEFNDEGFTDGVQVILDSYKPVRSCWFIEATINAADGKKTAIPLSMSSVDFPAGFEFDFFNDSIKPEQNETV